MPLGTPLRRMPIPEEVGEFLTSLLGTGVAVSKTGAPDLDDEPERWFTARYLDDHDRLAGACIADLGLAASAGAAIAMVPAPVAKESIDTGALAEGLEENFYEVANIITRLLNGPSVPHLRITELVAGVPEDLRALVDEAAGKKHYAVTINGYPGGTMTLLAGAT